LQAAELKKVKYAADLAREINEESRLKDELTAETAEIADDVLLASLAAAELEESRLPLKCETSMMPWKIGLQTGIRRRATLRSGGSRICGNC
jgi:hypothetical protein